MLSKKLLPVRDNINQDSNRDVDNDVVSIESQMNSIDDDDDDDDD